MEGMPCSAVVAASAARISAAVRIFMLKWDAESRHK
jgi:hypothetical protein